MPRRNSLPPQILTAQVVELRDALLANADRLLTSALAVLDVGHVGLVRSLAILGLEESGKAIALHERRVAIAYEPEGVPSVNKQLQDLWSDHSSKLKLVHDFLVTEKYWFGTEPPDAEKNAALLGEMQEWAARHNALKQRGLLRRHRRARRGSHPGRSLRKRFTTPGDQVRAPDRWQLRLGEHIVAKQQRDLAREESAASEAEVARRREWLAKASIDGDLINKVVERMRRGKPATQLNNDAYRLRLPEAGSNPFANIGKPGYEAQTREMLCLAESLGLPAGDTPDAEDEQS